jgi:hypothetical protein
MILYAASTGIGSYAGGNILDAVGQSSIQLLIAIIIGDLVSLRWRSLVYYGLALDVSRSQHGSIINAEGDLCSGSYSPSLARTLALQSSTDLEAGDGVSLSLPC